MDNGQGLMTGRLSVFPQPVVERAKADSQFVGHRPAIALMAFHRRQNVDALDFVEWNARTRDGGFRRIGIVGHRPPAPAASAVQGMFQIRARTWLAEEIDYVEAQRLFRRFKIAAAGDDDRFDRGVLPAKAFDEFQPAHAGQIELGDNDAASILRQASQSLLGSRRESNFKSHLGHRIPYCFAASAFAVNQQNGGERHRVSYGLNHGTN